MVSTIVCLRGSPAEYPVFVGNGMDDFIAKVRKSLGMNSILVQAHPAFRKLAASPNLEPSLLSPIPMFGNFTAFDYLLSFHVTTRTCTPGSFLRASRRKHGRRRRTWRTSCWRRGVEATRNFNSFVLRRDEHALLAGVRGTPALLRLVEVWLATLLVSLHPRT